MTTHPTPKDLGEVWSEMDRKRDEKAKEMGFAYTDSVDGKKIELQTFTQLLAREREEMVKAERERVYQHLLGIEARMSKAGNLGQHDFDDGYFNAIDDIASWIKSISKETDTNKNTDLVDIRLSISTRESIYKP